MALSNSIDFSLTAQSLFTHALSQINVIGLGETLDADEFNHAKETFSMLFRAWQQKYRFAWLSKEASLFLVDGQQSYNLYSSGDHATLSYVSTTTSAAASSGESAISVASTTGMSDGDYIGIELEDGSMQWTTINGAPGATVTLDDALTDDVDSGATVYAYTTRLALPERVLNVRFDDGDNEIALSEYGKADYEKKLQDKDMAGDPLIFYQKRDMDYITLYLWPLCEDSTKRAVLSVMTTVNDIDSVNDSIHAPAHWLRALKFNTAIELAPIYGAAISPALEVLARISLTDAIHAGVDDSTLQTELIY